MATAATVPDETPGGGAMPDDELVSYLQENAERAIGHYEGEIAADQAENIDFYYRRPMGDEVEGSSKVVDGTVGITVDNFVANVIKPFVSADETVRFEPRSEEDIEQAEQATEYVNYVLHCDNPGFMILHDWAKDAGMAKLGVVKIWWEDQTEKRPQLVENMDAEQIEALGDSIVDGPFVDNETGLFAAYVVSDYEDGRVKIENVPPEEYLISPYARPGQIPPYEAHRTRKTRSDLIELGVDADIVDDLPKYAGSLDDRRTWSRYKDESHDSTRTDAPGDPSRDQIEVFHEFALIDYDGDGVSELREIIRVDDVILYNEEADHGPFARFCPVPMPHKIYGTCPADQTKDDQRIKTVLQRQQLDNLYKANNPRPHIPEGSERSDGSTLDDLADSAPGAAVREGRVPIRYEAVPFVADKVYQMQEYIDREIERKSGISKEGNSLDKNAIKKEETATAAAIDEGRANARMEMMARIFAETGISDMFKIILKLLVKHQPRERIIRLRNKFVPMDPRQWNSEMDLSISVGLGVGNQAEQIAQAESVLAIMERVALSPFASLVNEKNVYAALKRALTAAGVKNIDEYLSEPQDEIDPETGEPVQKEPPPDPETMKVQAEAEAKQAEIQAKQQDAAITAQLKQAEAEAKIQLAREEASARLELERERAALEAQLARDKAQAELDLAQQKFAAEQAMATRRMEMEERLAERNAARAEFESSEKLKLQKNRPGGDLDK